MNNIIQKFISKEQAQALQSALSFGCPTEDRILIFTPNEEVKTPSGIYIPKGGDNKEVVPRKGVVVQHGTISEDYKSYKPLLTVGSIVTYGIYAGKELEFNSNVFDPSILDVVNNGKFTVLSLNEVIYVEANILGITNHN